MAAVVRWGAEAIWEAVAPEWPGFTVEVLPEIDSTNTELMRRARAGQHEPTLLVAEAQTAGRGRLGRSWVSRVGDSLTFSVGVALAPADWSGLSLAVGACVAEALDPQRTLGVRLKWPNDVWLGERKLAGILVETAGTGEPGAHRYAVVGIGINLATPEAVPAPPAGGPDAPAAPPSAVPPAGLREAVPGIDAPGLLARVVPALMRALAAFEQAGFAPFQARFAAYDLLADRAVRLSDGTAGTAHGVDETGALLVHTSAGMTRVSSAEVSVRPVS